MKEIGSLASVLNNTNKIISQSDADWSAIREGSYFKFNKDNVLYPVVDAKEFLYIKDFSVIDSNTIQVSENIDINLSVYDTLKISFKEYELLTVFTILDGGKGYTTGETLTIKGGVLVSRIETNTTQAAQLSVLQTNEHGEIIKIKIENKGLYLESPDEVVEVNGNGQGAKFKVQFKLLDNRSLIEREITEIKMNDNLTTLKLNYSLLNNLKTGKLSVNKWFITLATNYLQGTKICQQFDIARDFTLNLKLPLLAKNSFSTSAVYNASMVQIDKEITKIKEHLKI